MEPKFVSSKSCPICKHAQRAEIEAVLYRLTPKNGEEVLQQLSEAYDLDIGDLQRHAMFHAAVDLSPAGEETSIVRQIKMRETDMLAECARDYAETLSVVGKRIRSRAIEDPRAEEITFERAVNKSVVELYIGCGDNVRKTIKDIADINQILNGPKDDGLSGLGALAAAIANSGRSTPTTTEGGEE